MDGRGGHCKILVGNGNQGPLLIEMWAGRKSYRTSFGCLPPLKSMYGSGSAAPSISLEGGRIQGTDHEPFPSREGSVTAPVLGFPSAASRLMKLHLNFCFVGKCVSWNTRIFPPGSSDCHVSTSRRNPGDRQPGVS